MSSITSIQQRQAADNFAAQFPILVQRGIDEPTSERPVQHHLPGANPDSVVMANRLLQGLAAWTFCSSRSTSSPCG